VAEPGRLVEFQVRAGGHERPYLSYPDYVSVRDRVGALAEVCLTCNAYLSVRLPGGEEVTKGSVVSPNFFDLLGRPARLGATFHASLAGTPDARPGVVLSHGFWRDALRGDPSVVGGTLRIGGHDFAVLGVMPESFTGVRVGFAPALWIPVGPALRHASASTADSLERRDAYSLKTFARLAPGATLGRVNEELNRSAADPKGDNPHTFRALPLFTLPADQRTLAYPVAGLLMGVVGVVLLIACSSVSALLLVRSVARRREIAVRLALGASRGRLVRQLLTESVLLALAAGGVALLLSLWTLDLLAALVHFPGDPMYPALDLSPDWRVFTFTLAVSLLTGVAFGLVPAVQTSRPDLVPALKDQVSVAGAEFRSSRLRNVLVVSHVALAALLLIVAGLFVKDLRVAYRADPGFDADRLLVFDTNLSLTGYSPEKALAFIDRLEERLRKAPGVESVSVARHTPISPKSETATDVGPAGGRPGVKFRTTLSAVGPDYFTTAGIPILRGRAIDERDVPGAPAVAVVNQALAEKLWPGEDPVGRVIPGWSEGTLTVVGVARDSSYRVPGAPPAPHLYPSFRQEYRKLVHPYGMAVLMRAKGDARSLAEPVRREVAALDPSLALSGVRPLGEEVEKALWPLRTACSLFGAFGVLALVLAVAGVYGVVSYSVQLRRREIGIRMALGGSPGDLVRLFVRQGLGLVLSGVAAGTVLAFGLTRVLRPFLSGVGSADPETFLAVPALLTAVAVLAIWWPARRAARVDPMVALRYE
jgi:predicted permease